MEIDEKTKDLLIKKLADNILLLQRNKFHDSDTWNRKREKLIEKYVEKINGSK